LEGTSTVDEKAKWEQALLRTGKSTVVIREADESETPISSALSVRIVFETFASDAMAGIAIAFLFLFSSSHHHGRRSSCGFPASRKFKIPLVLFVI
jgi:hypothetical protein